MNAGRQKSALALAMGLGAMVWQSSSLAGAPPPLRHHPHGASDTELRRQLRDKINWSQLDALQRRHFLDSLNSAPRAV